MPLYFTVSYINLFVLFIFAISSLKYTKVLELSNIWKKSSETTIFPPQHTRKNTAAAAY